MTELEKKPVCWGCNRPREACICEDGFIPLVIKPPTEHLPFCKSPRGTEPWDDPKRDKEIMLRPCCICQKFWLCDYKEMINGDCPNCNAHGSFGTGHKTAY